MIQRVGIAQALWEIRKILILDEPTAGLDPKERVRFSQSPPPPCPNRIVVLSTHIVSRCGVGGEPGYAAEGSQTPSDGHGPEYLQPVSGQNLREKIREWEYEEFARRHMVLSVRRGAGRQYCGKILRGEGFGG